MPSPIDGVAISIVPPTDPETAGDAVVADPAQAAIAKQASANDVEPVVAHTPNQANENDDQPTSWIEIELVDEEDQPVAGERYEIKLPDGKVARGTLDQNGFARVEGIEAGECEVCFTELDESAWEPL